MKMLLYTKTETTESVRSIFYPISFILICANSNQYFKTIFIIQIWKKVLAQNSLLLNIDFHAHFYLCEIFFRNLQKKNR